jgi:hypothetical protein
MILLTPSILLQEVIYRVWLPKANCEAVTALQFHSVVPWRDGDVRGSKRKGYKALMAKMGVSTGWRNSEEEDGLGENNESAIDKAVVSQSKKSYFKSKKTRQDPVLVSVIWSKIPWPAA